MSSALSRLMTEAVTDGLSPEMAAEMLLEPSRWEEVLFNKARDLKTLYKRYLKGELGVGELADAVAHVADAAQQMSDLTVPVLQHYGRDVTPGDVPSSVVQQAEPEDEQVEVMQVQDNEFVTTIIDHIARRFPASLLEKLYAGGISKDDLIGFERGKFFNNTAGSARQLTQLLAQVGDLYRQRNWAELAKIYQTGGRLDQQLAGLAGDLMVMRDVAQAASRSGFSDYPVGGVSSFAKQFAYKGQQEAWEPALLDPEFTNEVKQVYQTLAQAASGKVTYRQLLDMVSPYAREGSQIFNMARRQSASGRARAPFMFDQANVNKLAGQGAAQQQQAGAQAAQQAVAGVDQRQAPFRGQEIVTGEIQKAMGQQPQAQPAPAPAPQPAAQQPAPAQPAPAPAPKAVATPRARAAVSQAATGEPAGALAKTLAPEGAQPHQTVSKILNIPSGGKVRNLLKAISAKQKPEDFAGALEDSMAALASLRGKSLDQLSKDKRFMTRVRNHLKQYLLKQITSGSYRPHTSSDFLRVLAPYMSR